MLIHILTSFTKTEAKKLEINYIRLLGFSTNGQIYLNKIKKDISLPIITNYKKDLSPLLDLELRATFYTSYTNSSEERKHNIKNSLATLNKITIMPTWRPWDYNTLVSDYKNSKELSEECRQASVQG